MQISKNPLNKYPKTVNKIIMMKVKMTDFKWFVWFIQFIQGLVEFRDFM